MHTVAEGTSEQWKALEKKLLQPVEHGAFLGRMLPPDPVPMGMTSPTANKRPTGRGQLTPAPGRGLLLPEMDTKHI